MQVMIVEGEGKLLQRGTVEHKLTCRLLVDCVTMKLLRGLIKSIPLNFCEVQEARRDIHDFMRKVSPLHVD